MTATEPATTPLSIRFPPDLINRLRMIARREAYRQGLPITVSSLIREAVEQWLTTPRGPEATGTVWPERGPARSSGSTESDAAAVASKLQQENSTMTQQSSNRGQARPDGHEQNALPVDLPPDWGNVVTTKQVADFLGCSRKMVVATYYCGRLRGTPLNDAPRNGRGRRDIRIWAPSVAALFSLPVQQAAPEPAGPEQQTRTSRTA
jgi:hypothetical protein